MTKVSTSEFRNGMNLRIDGEIYTIDEYQHVKPGKGGAFIRTKLKGVVNNKNIEKTFRSGEKIESVRVEHQIYQFLYADANLFYFMHQETYVQVPLEKSRVEKPQYMTEGDICTLVVDVDSEEILYAKPPDQITSKVVQTEPGHRGDTTQGSATKPATIESGTTVQVPLFINEGDEVKVDTRTGEYIERVNTN